MREEQTKTTTERLIFHVDVNSAFLSWESERRIKEGLPDLRDIPACIGGDPTKRTGIVVAKSILQSFSAAHDRGDAVLESFQHFFVYGLAGLCEVFSSLRVAKYNVFHASVCQHSRGDFACESTFLLKIHIFSTNLDVGAFCSLYNRDDIDGRYTENNVNVVICYQWF